MEALLNERQEYEERLIAILQEAWNVYHEYNPDGRYLHMSVTLPAENEFEKGSYDGVMSVNNSYYSDDENKPIDTYVLMNNWNLHNNTGILSGAKSLHE